MHLALLTFWFVHYLRGHNGHSLGEIPEEERNIFKCKATIFH